MLKIFFFRIFNAFVVYFYREYFFTRGLTKNISDIRNSKIKNNLLRNKKKVTLNNRKSISFYVQKLFKNTITYFIIGLNAFKN